MSEETQIDVLDQVKKIDKAIKAKLLIEKIAQLKEFAREVNVLREQSVATLEELDLSPKDIKRIIDYVNELPEVKLSERDKKEIRDDIHEEMGEQKTKTEKSFRDVDLEKLLAAAGSSSSLGWMTTTTGTGMPYGAGITSTLTVSDGPGVSIGDALYLSNAGSSSFVATIGNGAGESISLKL